MKTLIKNIFVAFLIIAIILGGSGIELFKHICFKHSLNKISLLESPKCEQESFNSFDSCCEIQEPIFIEPICCESESIPSDENKLKFEPSQKCCITSSELKVINESFFPPSENKVFCNINVILNSSNLELINDDFNRILSYKNNDLPPPISGRDLLNSIHQLKIDTPIS